MESIGIIAEYNPFHNGHLYHLKKIKEKYKDFIYIECMPEDKNNVAFYEKYGFSVMENGTAMQICNYCSL